MVTRKIKHLQNICKNVLVFYLTCNHGLSLPIGRCKVSIINVFERPISASAGRPRRKAQIPFRASC